MKKQVAVSKSNSKFQKYLEWLEENNVNYLILDWEKNNVDDIKKCSSLILTGGVDIYPELYNDWDDGSSEELYIPERDGFEFKILEYALEHKYPVLGICRGMQLINCKLGGNLISDLETIRGVNHRKISDTEERIHEIKVMPDTLLFEITRTESGTVNSSHHQAVDRLGEGLMISAKSSDGVTEAIELSDKAGKTFLLGIQWHPERMKDKQNSFAKNIIERFITETDKR
ncbi:MAG: gamma-glutamyl-gamma-aminobutyrate hydrolase family protein [Ignavibacteria bacterium]|nr:gamma-glutamyl-gamma-aminobutyrate hydrolase family protein [Ignavibacteria bacterium]